MICDNDDDGEERSIRQHTLMDGMDAGFVDDCVGDGMVLVLGLVLRV
jgi:hypothetical protein